MAATAAAPVAAAAAIPAAAAAAAQGAVAAVALSAVAAAAFHTEGTAVTAGPLKKPTRRSNTRVLLPPARSGNHGPPILNFGILHSRCYDKYV